MSAPPVMRPGQAPRPTPAEPPPRPPAPPAPPASRGDPTELSLTIALAVLMGAAVLPFGQIFTTDDWTRPLAGAVLLSCGVGVLSRRLRVGPVVGLLLSAVGLIVFTTVAFTPDDALFGLLPTPTSAGQLWALFQSGLELIETQPSPTFPDPGLLLLSVGGTWLIVYLADGLLFVMRTPVGAIVAAIVLWVVPLAVGDDPMSITRPAVAMVIGAGLVLLVGNVTTQQTFGTPVGTTRSALPVPVSGWAILAAVAALSVMAAPLLPGFQEEAVFRVTSGPTGGTTITTNPIVNIQDRLVAGDGGPVLHVNSPRPVYLRTTSLDTFTTDEQWLLRGTISGPRASGGAAAIPPALQVERIDVEVQIAGIENGAILAPAPHLTTDVSQGRARDMRYDSDSDTLIVPGRDPLVDGDRYVVQAALPMATPAELRAVSFPSRPDFLGLPPEVPPIAAQLAQQIVAEAGAATMFDQALAVQDRLRSWSYSVTPTFGEGSSNLERFINGREGYCEQFAGTMAVMLRTLGIPARLAVGYTPGESLGEGRWEVTNAHAHAWVEVFFDEYGWITFEPTPRTDGNVLVPGQSDLLPDQVQADQPTEQPTDGSADPVATPSPDASPTAGASASPQPSPSASAAAQDQAADQQGPDAAGADGQPQSTSSGRLTLLAAALLAVVATGSFFALRGQAGQSSREAPEVRVRRARASLQRRTAAAGLGRRPAETNDEYLDRLTAALAITPPERARTLAAAVATPASRADFATSVSSEDADLAEAAVADLREVIAGRASRGARLRMQLADLVPAQPSSSDRSRRPSR